MRELKKNKTVHVNHMYVFVLNTIWLYTPDYDDKYER